MSEWYFAYGSNMNPARMHVRGLVFDKIIAGWIPGLGLRFNKLARDHPGSGHANLVHAPTEHAQGVLYRLCGADMIRQMDPFERAPVNYSREAVTVQSARGVVVSWTYFANPSVTAAPNADVRPTGGYLYHLLQGSAFLSADYAARLRAQPLAGQP